MRDPVPSAGGGWGEWWVRAGMWAGVGALSVALTVQKLWSADTWTLLSIGRWVVEHRAWPRVEEWSYTAAGRDWHELRWLFCVVMYGLWRVGGAGAVVVGQCALVGVAFWVLGAGRRGNIGTEAPGNIFTLGRGAAGTLVAGVVALGLCAGASRWVMRPELVTYVMVAAYLAILGSEASARWSESASQRVAKTGGEQKVSRWLWVLPVLQVVWVNSHPMFVIGPLLAWSAVVGETAKYPKGQSAKPVWGRVVGLVVVALSVSVACLANPYGIEGALQPVRMVMESQGGLAVTRHISELQSVFGSPLATWRLDTWCAVLLVAAAVVMSVIGWRRVSLFRGMVVVLACALVAGAQRNLGLVAVMGTWAVLDGLSEGVEGRRERGWARAAPVAIGCACLVAAWFVVSDRYWVRYGISKEFGLGVVRSSVAEGAADFVIQNGAKGKVYNGVGDGGYLIWRGIVPVYVDGRMEVRSKEFLRDYFEGSETWATTRERWGINTVVLPRNGFEWLAGELGADASWVRVYEDVRNVVYVRDIAEHAELIARRRSVGGGGG